MTREPRIPSVTPLGAVGPYLLEEELPKRREVFEYLARQRVPGGFERLCTLKIAKRSSDARGAESLAREAKVMARLDHPNIVRMHDFFDHDGDRVLVLERFSGLSLERLLARLTSGGARVDDRITWHVALSLFDALAHAHGLVDQDGQPAPVLHRDVRPANVLVASDGRVRLTGFSFARDVDLDESTAVAAVYRAPSYVAPEILRATRATDRADAFSAALVIWEMLTGRQGTQRGLTDFELLKHLASRQLESLRTARPDLPALVSTALDACLMTDSAQRRIGCVEVAGCIRAGIESGDGVAALREAIAALGSEVERLAGGRAAVPPTPQHLTIDLGGAPHRPEATTIPDAAPASKADDMAAYAASMPDLLSPVRTEPVLQVPSLATASNDEAPDEYILAMKASHARRRTIRIAMTTAPIAITLGVLLFALGGGTSTPMEPVQAQASPSTTQPVAPHAESSVPERSDAPPAASVRPAAASDSVSVPAKQGMLIVRGPPEGDVYVMGKRVGKTDEPILTECGQRFVRVGTPAHGGAISTVRWIGTGRSVRLRCGEKTVVSAGE